MTLLYKERDLMSVSDAAAESKELKWQKTCGSIRYIVNVSEFGFY